MNARRVSDEDFISKLFSEITFISTHLIEKSGVGKEDEQKFISYQSFAKKIATEVQTKAVVDVNELYGEFLRSVKRFKRRIDNQMKFQERDLDAFRKRYEQTGKPLIPLIHDIKMNVLDRMAKLDMSQLRNPNFPMHLYTNKDLCDLVFKIMDFQGFYKLEMELSTDDLRAIIKSLCLRYNVVPYHNWTHAFSVFQMMFCIYEQSQTLRDFVTPFEFFCSQLAALGHDLNHKGVGNLYKQKRNSQCSRNYCEQGVLEGMHSAQMFQILQGDTESGTPNLFASIKDQTKVNSLKRITVACIMGTDMGKHQKSLAKIQRKVAATIRSSNPSSPMKSESSNIPLIVEPFKKENFDDRKFILKSVLHACDIGNPCLEFNNYLNWSYLITQEFSDQTAKEAKIGLPVTSFLVFKDRIAFLNGQLFFCSNKRE